MRILSPGTRLLCRLLMIAALLIGSVSTAMAQQITFKRAIELALKRSGTIAIGVADQVRTHESYLESKNAYLPSVILGSGLGYQIGVPLSVAGSAPSIFNITTQQYVLNFAQHDFIRAARTEWKASDIDMQDRRDAVVQDAAILYSELATALGKLRALHEQENAAQRAQVISAERLKEGLQSELDLKKAKLTRARVEVRLAQAEGDADVVREKLGKMIGIPAASLDVVEDSIPGAPPVSQDADLAKIAAATYPAALMADARAVAAEQKAKAESRVLMPSIDFATQYAMFAAFNNYDEFYRKFSRNNYSFGAEIRFPLFNRAQQAHAAAARADAVKARKQAEEVRNQVSADTLKLQRSVRQLSAARDVAKLEYEIAQATMGATQTKVQSGGATPADYEDARIDTSDKYTALLDASLELYRAQVQLMRVAGDLQSWAATASDAGVNP